MNHDNDTICMRRALELAWGVKGTTFPNPAVGAVVVDADGNIVGEGATGVYGGPHAEAAALRSAGERARGGTLYVTLEPCPHFGRTPPCVDAIVSAGIRRVVASVKDPNPLVGGKGLRKLRARGIDVLAGLLRDEAVLVNEDFFWSVTRNRPWVTLKLAMTLDGRVADSDGNSKWITSPESRRAVQDIRRCHSAVAVGKNTLLCDNPKLTARCGKKIYYPARIVFSSSADIPKDGYFFTRRKEARTIVVIKNAEKRRIDIDDGVEYWHTGKTNNAECINTFLDMSHNEGLTSVLIEGGQKLASAFLQNNFVNKAHLFYGNKITGGGILGVRFSQGLSIADCVTLSGVTHRSFGDDFLMSGYVETRGLPN